MKYPPALGVALAAVSLLALAASADQLPPAPPNTPETSIVTVELALLKSHSLRLKYRFPSSCEQLPLRNPYSDSQLKEMRKAWRPANGCGAEKDGSIIRTDGQCDTVDFDVPIQATLADRVYPAAFPIDGLGVYVHTGIYAPTSACGHVKWQLRSESGEVVYQGEERGDAVIVPETDSEASYMAAYLSNLPLPLGAKTALSPQLPEWIRFGLNEATGQVQQGYGKRFSGLAYSPPFVVASSASTQGPPHQQAEVAAGNVIRYAFFNYPDEPQPEDITRIRGIIAHEYGHKLQPVAIRKASGESDNLVHEGGAEYLRWSSMLKLGWSSQADAQKDLNTALNTCLAIIGDQAWQRVEGRSYGEAPYACGLSLHVLLMASRADWQKMNADEVLESFYKRNEDGILDFGQALECGESPRCKARWAHPLLSNTTGFASEIGKLIGSAGLAKQRFSESIRPLQQKSAAATLMQIMDGDCDGTRGFYSRDNGFEVGMSPNCKTFLDGMLITSANGLSLIAEPLKAARDLVTKCAVRHSATIGLSDGGSFEVGCRDLAPIAPYFYDLDIGKVLKRLGIAPERSPQPPRSTIR
jgi:hypothetical protein